MIERAERAEQLKLHALIYEYGNWYVHSGYCGFPGQEPHAACQLCTYAYMWADLMLSEATRIICRNVPTTVDAKVEWHLKQATLIYCKRMYEAKLSTEA